MNPSQRAEELAEKEYPPAWGPSPGGMSVDHNHAKRAAHASALKLCLPLLDRLAARVEHDRFCGYMEESLDMNCTCGLSPALSELNELMGDKKTQTT